MEKYFKELDVLTWQGKTVIVDIDGTITTDGSYDVDQDVSKKIQEIKSANPVFLFSNKQLPGRNSKLADVLGATLLITPFKKPNRKVINGLPDNLRKNLVVIGDKILVDGVFAKNIGADFIKVRRLTGKNDSIAVKLIYFIDDIASKF